MTQRSNADGLAHCAMLLYNKDVQENNCKNTDYLNLLLMSKDGTSQNGDDKKRTKRRIT